MFKINILATNDCNAKSLSPVKGAPGVCDFCFRAIEHIESSEEHIRQIVKSLDSIKICEPVTITGGEPLVSPFINLLIDLLIKKKHQIALHTNGILLPQFEDILSQIKYISLPYDGHCAELTDYYRGEGYFQLSKNAFYLAYKNNLQIGLHTLATPHNISRLVDMGNSLMGQYYFGNIWYWYIKRFKKINRALAVDTTPFVLDENVYQNTIRSIKNQFNNINILESGQVAKSITTLFISLDGNVYIFRKGHMQNEYIGNILCEQLSTITQQEILMQ